MIRPRLEPIFSNAPAIDEQITDTIASPPTQLAMPAAPDTPTAPTGESVVRAEPIEATVENPRPFVEEREIVIESPRAEQPTAPRESVQRKLPPPTLAATPAKLSSSEQKPLVRPSEPHRVKTPRHFALPSRPAAARVEQSHSESDAPIVRVTIGRVDVRAVSAPAPAARKPARPTPPALTLDAYLNSRKGGAR
jgi:hypothetical protein